MSSFTAKDGDGTNFEVAAHHDTGNGIFYPMSAPALDRPLVSQMVDSLGTGLGTVNLIADYSATVTDFWIEPPAGEIWHLTRFIGFMEYNGALRADRYGSAVLPNGIKLITEINAVESDFMAQENVVNLAEWARLVHDLSVHEFGTGTNFASWRGSFVKGGAVVVLDGDTNDKLIIRLNDDHTDLEHHHFTVQGYKLVGS